MSLTLVPHPLIALEGRTVASILGRVDDLMTQKEHTKAALLDLMAAGSQDQPTLDQLYFELAQADHRIFLYRQLAMEVSRE